ncbi:3-isopropylmalate dehydratase large subunit [Candidatus Bathyarchaeota archaeon]|nr:MAG: 3-isopropylmalate dehydratase large subunit [Candidatus Bathyarchaeota archaeon]
MGKTISEKILSHASGRDVYAGDIVVASIDAAMMHDGMGQLVMDAFREMGGKSLWDATRVAVVIDHVAPSAYESFSKVHKAMREFAFKHNTRFYEVGSGVCHQLMIESGLVFPGGLVVGSDSHTCTYGALGAFATGIGSTEMAAVFLSGKLWFKVPETIKITVQGELPPMIFPKDVILKIVGTVKADGATYKAIEFGGSTIEAMNVEGRLTLTNMAVEMGAKTGMIEPDEKTYAFLKALGHEPKKGFKSDEDAEFCESLKFDVSNLEPQVACPHAVDNVKPVKSVEGKEIDQVFLGSCTNGRLYDLRVAAEILKGRHVKRGVRVIVTPASRRVYREALKEGLIEIFLDSGCAVCNPGCGPCAGGHQGILAPGERCVSTSNRNFKARMGSSEAEIYLVSPATAAASAITGEITDPRRFLKGG